MRQLVSFLGKARLGQQGYQRTRYQFQGENWPEAAELPRRLRALAAALEAGPAGRAVAASLPNGGEGC